MVEEIEELNIYQKIMKARRLFQEEEIKKSGENKFQNFQYLELQDIVPPAIKICEELGLYSEVQPNGSDAIGFATMTIINVHNPAERVMYKIRSPSVNTESGINTKLQDTGKIETYLRRYLYMLFLDIAVPDEVDKSDNSIKKKKIETKEKPVPKKVKTKPKKVEKVEDKPKKKVKTKPKKSEPEPKNNQLGKILNMSQLDELSKSDENLKNAITTIRNIKGMNITKKDILSELVNMIGEGKLTPDEKMELQKQVVAYEV